MTNTFIIDKIFNKCQTFSGTHFPSSGQNRQNECLKCTVQYQGYIISNIEKE